MQHTQAEGPVRNPDVSPKDMALLADAAKAVDGRLSQGQGRRRVNGGQEWVLYGMPGIAMSDGITRHPLSSYGDACELVALMDLQLSFCRQEQKVTVSSGSTAHGSFQSSVSYQDYETKQNAACRAVVTLLASMGAKSA